MKGVNEVIITLNQRPVSWQHAYIYRAFGKGKLIKFLSQKAKEYKAIVITEYHKNNTYNFKDTEISCSVQLFLKGKRKLDIDNATKLIFDSLNGHVYNDDSQIRELYIYKEHGCVEDKIIVKFTPFIKNKDNI